MNIETPAAPAPAAVKETNVTVTFTTRPVARVVPMFNPFIHVALILLALVICLLPLASPHYVNLIAESKLREVLGESELVKYSIIAAIAITVPMAFDFLLDFIYITSLLMLGPSRGGRSINSPIVRERLHEIVFRFFSMSSLVGPNLAMIAVASDNTKVPIFFCLSYWRDITQMVIIMYILAQRDTDIWNSRNTLIISFIGTAAFLIMEYNCLVNLNVLTILGNILFLLTCLQFLYLYLLSLKCLVIFSCAPPNTTPLTKSFYISAAYSTCLLCALIGVEVRIHSILHQYCLHVLLIFLSYYLFKVLFFTDGGKSYLDSNPVTIAGYNGVMMSVVMVVVCIPVRVARFETRLVTTSLLNAKKQMATKIAPAIQTITDSVNALKVS